MKTKLIKVINGGKIIIGETELKKITVDLVDDDLVSASVNLIQSFDECEDITTGIGTIAQSISELSEILKELELIEKSGLLTEDDDEDQAFDISTYYSEGDVNLEMQIETSRFTEIIEED